VSTGKEIVVQGGAKAADVEIAGGAGGKSDANGGQEIPGMVVV
jgi:hypothetical protein